MDTQTPSPSFSELTQAEKTTSALQQVPGEEAKHRLLTLNDRILSAVNAVTGRTKHPALIQQSKVDAKVAVGLLSSMVTGGIAVLTADHPTRAAMLKPSGEEGPEAAAQMLIAVLTEMNTPVCLAAATCVQHVLSHHERAARGVTEAQDAKVTAADDETTAKLQLELYTTECNLFINKNTPADHPAREALRTRIVRRGVPPMVEAQAQLLEEQQKQELEKLKQQSSEALKLARAKAKEEARALRRSGVVPPTGTPKS